MHLKPPQCSQLPYLHQDLSKEGNSEPRGAGGQVIVSEIGGIEPRRRRTWFVHLARSIVDFSRMWKKVVYGIILELKCINKQIV